ncbi:flagellar hook-associated protein 2 [Bacillus mesophilus]|uniref:Flagellar hook-associated protein 2 n=1 Tax=Bacillus mesophilus TaxID=1808955 RepID=A0A6M0Q7D3_9BACI|nr:flagellar filament capping protein FliD [Bacillus mesophilus]MBM7661583.1 flagellar hook-associated protein 2 [Bacillus mesophilus]NEY72252.1 flagellar filament capping protein FliD [Bacillus mesophilus]
MRISGLASGMDTESIVRDLMKAERIPLNKLKQQKQRLEWQRDGYREMNSLLLSLRNETFNMKLSSKYRVRSVNSTDDNKVTASATSLATESSYSITEIRRLASAATKVNNGSISSSSTNKIDTNKDLYSEQSKLVNSTFNWKAGSVESKTMVAEADRTEFNLELNTTAGTKVVDINNTIVKVDGKSYKVVGTTPANSDEVWVKEDGTLSFKDPIRKGSSVKVDFATNQKIDTYSMTSAFKEIQLSKSSIFEGSPLQIKVGVDSYSTSGTNIIDSANNIVGSIDYKSGKLTFTNEITIPTGQTSLDVSVTYAQNYFSFDMSTFTSKGQINENFLIQGSESLTSTLGKINNSNLGLTAFYDSFSDQVTFTRNETGNYRGADGTTNATLNDPLNHEILTSAGFIDDVLRFSGATETGGDNANFTINGLQTERTTNIFEMSGVTFTLKNKLAMTEPPVSISIKNDTNGVFDNIKSFVDKYNEIITKIQEKTSETFYREYLPLTDEQRESLSDKQQEQWEEKAKSGLLRRDSLLSGVLSQMRTDFYLPVTNSEVDSNFNQLATIGLTTSPNYLEGGKLYLDEAKLKKAIEENPSSVEKLFTSSGSTNGELGIVNRLYNSTKNFMDKITERAGSSLSTNSKFTIGKNLLNIDSRINRFEDKLTRTEDRYWRQFTAMEKAIQRSNEQSMFLMNAFNGGM